MLGESLLFYFKVIKNAKIILDSQHYFHLKLSGPEITDNNCN